MPFYLFGQSGELRLDLGIVDRAGGGNWMRVHRLTFTVGGEEAPEEDLLPPSEPL